MRLLFSDANEYLDKHGQSPYSNWLNKLKDKKDRAAIISYVDRMELGYFGDHKSVGHGIVELRIHTGPGYRIYSVKEGKHIYLLLCGGDKSTQKKDTKKAQQYWIEHKRGTNHG